MTFMSTILSCPDCARGLTNSSVDACVQPAKHMAKSASAQIEEARHVELSARRLGVGHAHDGAERRLDVCFRVVRVARHILPHRDDAFAEQLLLLAPTGLCVAPPFPESDPTVPFGGGGPSRG